MSKYIIVNAEAIQKRIEELKEGLMLSAKGTVARGILLGSISQLEQILSESTLLIPEIEKAFEAGIDAELLSVAKINCTVEDYISNLKLDI